MIRQLLFSCALLCTTLLHAQTYFYIDQITVDPTAPTDADNITINLVGNLSSTGAYVASASANVDSDTVTITIAAMDNGGLSVLVPHIEPVTVGQLPAGTYTIVFVLQGVGDFAPEPEHTFVVTGEGGDPCDNLDILSIQWHAFSDTAIVLHVLNNDPGFELFDYPNFILYDQTGDTLAKELVNFFGLGAESWHVLRVMDGAVISQVPFVGQLELWTLFTTELACSWELPITLCPPEPCATLIPSVESIGGALAIGTYQWAILDEDLDLVAIGELEMTDTQQADYDTICVPPGNYTMEVVPDDPPTGGAPRFGVNVEGWIGGPSQPITWDMPPIPMPFEFYIQCADGTNGIHTAIPFRGINLVQQGGVLQVQRQDGEPLGPVELYDVQGRLRYQGASTASSLSIPVAELGSGVFMVRAGNAVQRTVLLSQ